MSGGIPALLLQRVPHDPHLVGELRGRLGPGAKEAVALRDRAPERDWVAAAEPDRRVWLLERLRLHGRAAQLLEAPVEPPKAETEIGTDPVEREG